MTLSSLLPGHDLIVCVGTGGVGKTTVAASIAIAAACSGRRTVVLTIDPARALARAFGLESLTAAPERIRPALLEDVGIKPLAPIDAAMLDAHNAWDSIVTRLTPNPAVRDRILRNRFYQQFSRRFPGSTEYVAMDEVARLRDSGHYDLIVLDTPPAEHALDFIRAPGRLDRLLTPDVEAWTQRRESEGVARWIFRMARAVGSRTFRDVTDFFAGAGTFIGAVRERSATLRALLHQPTTAFVLITGASEALLSEAGELAGALVAEDIELSGVIFNRVHALLRLSDSTVATARVGELLRAEGLSSEITNWLCKVREDALVEQAGEESRRQAFQAALPHVANWTLIPELDHDVCSMTDLGWMARQ
jgi:anion-transporting  ArsA/GET3 family ATPase